MRDFVGSTGTTTKAELALLLPLGLFDHPRESTSQADCALIHSPSLVLGIDFLHCKIVQRVESFDLAVLVEPVAARVTEQNLLSVCLA